MSRYCGHSQLKGYCQLCEYEDRIAELEKQRDAAFKMSGCECGVEECCQNLANLDKHIAELEAERRWIPVSERLPKDSNTIVLTFDGRYLLDTFTRLLWEMSGVTHWMPLPEAPEVNE